MRSEIQVNSQINKSFLFFLVHPSKFYLFRFLINRLIDEGNNVDILIIKKDVLEDLIKKEGWNYKNIYKKGRKYRKLPRTIAAFLSAFITIIKLFLFLFKKKKYDYFITDDILVIPGFLLKIKTFLFVDNDYKTLSLIKYLLPFATKIICPSSTELSKFRKKLLKFRGNKALAYLSPKYFTPDRSKVLIESKYSLIRVSILDAVHDDENNKGIQDEELTKLINLLEIHGKVYISAEREISNKFEKYRLNIDPIDMAHYINFSKILITDSGTMASEAAVLGVPNILINNLAGSCGVHRELNNYNLQYFYDNFDDAYKMTENLLSKKNIKEIWKQRRKNFLTKTDDFTEFFYNLLK
tara:strand:- start:675 stop:1736 length:1062 start_codon:yes stop_codon:yes gene_type:complete